MAPPAVTVRGPAVPGSDRVLTDESLAFVADLQRRFGPVRLDLLRRREERQAELDAGVMPDFLPGTLDVREDDWTVAPAPADLDDRRVEITGPAEPKMMINALNSGARVFMADLEDALSPTWANVVGGQAALMDAVRGTLTFDSPEGKSYRVGERPATLLVRPRGWHLVESNVLVDDVPISASLFDAGLYLFHNAAERVARGTGPYFYLPKLESHHEARLWNEVFVHAQTALGVPRGSVRATVLIETILAAFEMDEILYELREHAAGLNAGRWDYLFSAIKKFRTDPSIATPDRAQLTMTVPFMRAYTELLVQTCHRRGAHAIGGMAAFIPNRRDPAVTEVALAKVRDDKERESRDGFDGTWVAHPDLVPIATEVFDGVLGAAPNQKHRLREEVSVTAADLLDLSVAGGRVTEVGLRANIRVALAYLDSWLRGVGAAAIDNLMEDAATAEISRSQLWLWITQQPSLEDGRVVDPGLYASIRDEELARLREGGEGRLADAAELLDRLVLADDFAEFLTLRAYALLDVTGSAGRSRVRPMTVPTNDAGRDVDPPSDVAPVERPGV
jgi:malate synthase